ncbi:hypothetical protein [Caulobacter sp. DWR2-3-1b2]|uniref:hypothetical protein n=1 Tax=unclassified Caulobacter TaxID=2648921 RepID=UPI003CF4B423
MMERGEATFEFAGGDIALWDDDGVLMLKLKEPHSDPVELVARQALELGEFIVT